jgi:glycosyltransferase involved in cell wall biosynthesis
MKSKERFFTIITVAKNDVWSLTKTMRSIFRQSYKNIEYIVVDSNSNDGTKSLLEFWYSNNLITNFVSEPDTSVYNAMNKGLRLANGEFICFLNANDVFFDDYVLEKVHKLLENSNRDGILGWGQLNNDIWASWAEDEAIKLSSLGFCHQALFVKRQLLLTQPFDERPFKTDSDTLQLGHLYAKGANIAIVPEVFAIRGGDKGISADLEKTKKSIQNTIVEEYSLQPDIAEKIINFRHRCLEPEYILKLLSDCEDQRLCHHLGCMVLDTLFRKKSSLLNDAVAKQLLDAAYQALNKATASHLIERLLTAQTIRLNILKQNFNERENLKQVINRFKIKEDERISKTKLGSSFNNSNSGEFLVSLTSFPDRISTLHFVIQSLITQTLPPKEIHLWLGGNEIPSKRWLPRELLALEKYGLRIFFVPKTFHQYDKFLHNSQENKNRPFIIVDDDVIYPITSLESLLKEHLAYPSAVIANRCHLMAMTEEGNIEPYIKWQKEVAAKRPSLRLMPTGVGGVLYPPNFLNQQMVTNISDILANAPYADDIWLKACTLAKGVSVVSSPLAQNSKWRIRYTPTMKVGALHETNVDLGLNDVQIQRCLSWLNNIRPAWKEEFIKDV